MAEFIIQLQSLFSTTNTSGWSRKSVSVTRLGAEGLSDVVKCLSLLHAGQSVTTVQGATSLYGGVGTQRDTETHKCCLQLRHPESPESLLRYLTAFPKQPKHFKQKVQKYSLILIYPVKEYVAMFPFVTVNSGFWTLKTSPSDFFTI